MKNIIKIVTKDFYKKHFDNKPELISYTLNSKIEGFEEVLDSISDSDIISPYYTVNIDKKDYFIIYIYSMDILMIPKVYENQCELLNKISSSRLDLSNWIVSRVSDTPLYIKNTYLKPNPNKESLCEVYKDGVYEIFNSDSGEVFRLSIRTINIYYQSSFIAWDEIAYSNNLFENRELSKKEQLFRIILENNGRQFIKESNIES